MDDAAVWLASNLKRLRDRRGLSQQSLADLSGVPRPTVAHLESGAANPTLSVLTRVALALGVGLEDIVGAPTSAVRHYPARVLPRRNRGAAVVLDLLPDVGPSLSLERVELPAGTRIAVRAGAARTRCYVTCEAGEVELSLGDDVFKVAAGEVLAFDGAQPAGFVNRTRRKAVCYSVTAPSPLS